MHYRNLTEPPFSCSDVGEQQREGECAEVRKLRLRSSKGTLMDLEIQVGDMKEEQDAVLLHKGVSKIQRGQLLQKQKDDVFMQILPSFRRPHPAGRVSRRGVALFGGWLNEGTRLAAYLHQADVWPPSLHFLLNKLHGKKSDSYLHLVDYQHPTPLYPLKKATSASLMSQNKAAGCLNKYFSINQPDSED